MEPLSSYSHRESAQFHLIMNVCGENPIMALLHQAYRKHRNREAKAFMGHISQLDEGYCVNQILFCELVSVHEFVCVSEVRNNAFTTAKSTFSLQHVDIIASFFIKRKKIDEAEKGG